MKSAVVGCGNISRFHLHAINVNPITTLTGICDVNRDMASRRAQEMGVPKFYTDFDTMLNNEQINVLHVLVPPAQHCDVAVKAMERGIHVIVEKPMTLSVNEADRMINAARTNNVKLCVNHNMMYDPTVIKAREIVNSFKFGELLHVESFFAFDTRRVIRGGGLEGTWMNDIKGHFLQDLLPHPASIVLDFLKGYTEAHIINKQSGNKLKDEVRILFDSPRATGAINLSLSTRPDIFTLDLYGSKMILRVDLANMSIVKMKMYDIPKFIARGLGSMSQSRQIFNNTIVNTIAIAMKKKSPTAGMINLINAFYKSIEQNWPVPVSGEDSRRIVELSDKIWK